jgi:hypothetical protein
MFEQEEAENAISLAGDNDAGVEAGVKGQKPSQKEGERTSSVSELILSSLYAILEAFCFTSGGRDLRLHLLAAHVGHGNRLDARSGNNRLESTGLNLGDQL